MDPAGGIARQESPGAELMRDHYRSATLFPATGLIKVQPAFQNKHPLTRPIAQRQSAMMAVHGGAGQAGYIAERDTK
jgi:hypothetical protein